MLIVGAPAGDDELLGVVLRSLPGDVPVGRANVGGTLTGYLGRPSLRGRGRPGHGPVTGLGLAMVG